MKTIKILSIAIGLSVAALVTTAFISLKHTASSKNINAQANGFAVVELYTSEGCSSCPPADELVARIQKESSDKPVYILAFHVDYWNRLGWKDVFSSAAYSQRQNQYASWLNLSSVYTPQIVVNGSTEFVGSEENNLRSAIKKSLQKSAKTQLALSDVKIKNNEANVQYQVQGNIRNSSLLIALVERSATTKVQRGENSGRTLSHVQIVTNLQSIPLKNQNGLVNIALPHGFSTDNWEVIGFVQNTTNGEITGACKSGFLTDSNTTDEPVKNSK